MFNYYTYDKLQKKKLLEEEEKKKNEKLNIIKKGKYFNIKLKDSGVFSYLPQIIFLKIMFHTL